MSDCFNGSLIVEAGSCDESDSIEIGERSSSEQQGDDESSCIGYSYTGGGVFVAGFVTMGCSLVCFRDCFFLLEGYIYGLV